MISIGFLLTIPQIYYYLRILLRKADFWFKIAQLFKLVVLFPVVGIVGAMVFFLPI